MLDFKHIYSPLKIGRMTVKNRIETAPAMPFLGTMNCDLTSEFIEWEKAFARGGAGIVTIGDTPIMTENAMKVGYRLDLGTDKSINALNRLAEAIQRYDAKVSIELTHHVNHSPTDMTLEQINVIIKSYADAAFRCMKAGMDMIMIHGAHGHLISQFVSPRRNFRTDAYGGSTENRARFVTEILDAIRSRVGDKLAIEYRISADELIPDGLCCEEQLEFSKMIQDKIDLLHVSAGSLYEVKTLPRMIQPTYVQRGINVQFAELFKKELDIPVAAVGSLDIEMAEQIVAANKADMVAMNRTFIADPNCVEKARNRQTESIRPCVRCNTCISRTSQYLSVRCAVNPQSGREAEFINLPAPVKTKKVVIIGGGPAGMEAARTAADRGHKVTLFEKEKQLGGNLILAASAPFKRDMRKYLDWAVNQTMNNPNITVKLSAEATPEMIADEKPNSLIIAVGAVPIIPNVPGIEKQNVFWAGDVDSGKAKVGDRVVMVGAGLTGSETALYLAQQGKQVTMIDLLSLEEINRENPFINILALRDLLNRSNVLTRTETMLAAITDNGVFIRNKDLNEAELNCDTVILSLGVRPRNEMVEMLKTLAPEVYVVGDCRNQRGNLFKAITEGFNAAMEI